ncbi:MAG: hypothetical protein LBB85_02375, partial [Dysgonamonadaceae bacterium]|nr:hypothetical protein [Dysgonamonadaceae bacterium]
MKKRSLILFLTLAAAFATKNVDAQTAYPVYVQPQLMPPYALTLADYAQPGSQRLLVSIQVRDVNIINLPVRLHLKIENMTGTVVESLPNLTVTPLYLTGGEVRILFG